MFRGFIYVASLLALIISAHFNSGVSDVKVEGTLNYLPLGDSYTIGTGAKKYEAWPYVLATHLNEQNIKTIIQVNPARNGFTTDNLITEELPLLKKIKPDFVTLLIGVNDWVRGVSKEDFRKNLSYILNEVQKELKDKKKIIVVTIPDFGVTATGKTYAVGRNISLGIADFNTIILAEAKKRDLVVVDIFETSKEMEKDLSLVAEDGLHPSAKEYAIWEKLILPEAVKLVQ